MDERLGIVGTGAIATGLARLAADHGDVVMWARSEGSAERASTVVEDMASVVTDFEALRDCTLVVEAVAEDEELKANMHRLLGDLLPPRGVDRHHDLVAVGPAARRGERPPGSLRRPCTSSTRSRRWSSSSWPSRDEASNETRERFRALCEHLDKTAVEVPDAAGFVVNRLLFPYLFDAVRMLERDGLSAEAVDTCMKLGAGHPMGPLALLDFVGLDVAAAIGESIGADVPDRVHELVAEGRLGRKSGAGFYEYG